MQNAEPYINTGYTVVAIHKHRMPRNYWWPDLAQAMTHFKTLQARKNMMQLTIRDGKGFINQEWKRDV